MKKSQADRIQVIKIMNGWLWPFTLLAALFAIGFVIMLDISLLRGIIAMGLLGIQSYLAYGIRYRDHLARKWFLFILMAFLNLTFFTIPFAICVGFRLQWFEDGIAIIMLLIGLIGVVGLTWCYYTPLMKGLLEKDCTTKRFDLEKGTFSLLMPPSFYEFKTPLLRKAMEILLPYSGILIAISAASGVHGGRNLLMGRDIGTGILFLLMAVFFIAAATCTLYTYLWIRRWEKQTGCTMWIKGFEP
jgi:hypothetical protein